MSDEKQLSDSECENCRTDVDGDICPVNGKVCIRSHSMNANDLITNITKNDDNKIVVNISEKLL